MTDERVGATPRGTKDYVDRMVKCGVLPEHYRMLDGLLVSSVGIGTYLGRPDDATDAAYHDAIIRAVELGGNFIDTASNYRYQRSERAVGRALATLFASGTAKREEIVVATKAGFVPFDGHKPEDPAAWIEANIIAPGLAARDEIAAGCHCMTPKYLRHQIEASLENLGVDSIDLFYLHNPETQLQDVSRRDFLLRLQEALGALEAAVSDGLIRSYGIATWNGFRASPDDTDYLSVEEVVRAARAAVGAGGHHWSALQLPFNVAMHEAFSFENQLVSGRPQTTADAATGRGIGLVASGAIMQGKLADELPGDFEPICPGLDTDAQRALQFSRSAPRFVAALCGMSQVAHVEENMKLARVAPVSDTVMRGLFQSPN